MYGLQFSTPLPANVNDVRSTGQVKMHIDPTTQQPYWTMSAYAHDTLTALSTYAAYWLAKRPTTAEPVTGFEPMVGICMDGITGAGWTELLIAGYARQVVSSGAIPAGSGCEVLTTEVALKDDTSDAPLMTSETIGHSQVAASNNLVDVWLYGRHYIEIKSS